MRVVLIFSAHEMSTFFFKSCRFFKSDLHQPVLPHQSPSASLSLTEESLTLIDRSSPPRATMTLMGGRVLLASWFSMVALMAFCREDTGRFISWWVTNGISPKHCTLRSIMTFYLKSDVSFQESSTINQRRV